jgi:predicted nucleic acid-binding protein
MRHVSVMKREGTLLVPTGEDWWIAGKVLNSLLRGLKSRAQGRTPKLHPDEISRIVRDVLIARTARNAGVLLVTNNIRHFHQIKPFCDLRIISGTEFFGY